MSDDSGFAFDRVPPQDIAAELCVLGGMMQSRDAIADVEEVIGPDAHYRPAHQIIHETILALYDRRDDDGHPVPINAVTVKDELSARKQLRQAGGAPHLHTCIEAVPTAANAGYYARIVRKHSIRRQVIAAATTAVQMAYEDGGIEPEEIAERAAKLMDAAAAGKALGTLPSSADLLAETLDDLERAAVPGLPTGWRHLDEVFNGMKGGQFGVIGARTAVGKALSLDTPLPTPAGWTTMGAVEVGDQLLGSDGRPTCVVATTEVMHGRPCYEVEFSDGTVIVADAQHQWKTSTRAARRQGAEHRTRYYWTPEQRERVRRAANAAACEPDRLVTSAEIADEVGREFLVTIRAKVIRAVPSAGTARRVVRRGVRVGVNREHERDMPVYSRQQALKELLLRVGTAACAAQAHNHPEIVTTAEIARTLHEQGHNGSRYANHAVINCTALQLGTAELPVPAYVLGVWLGDSNSRVAQLTTTDPEILNHLESEGVSAVEISGLYRYSMRFPEQRRGALGFALRSIGVLRSKHIPGRYLRASEQQRRELLAGLLDTDGTVNQAGSVQFCVTSRRLAEDTRELILSLGYNCGWSEKPVNGHTAESSTAYVLTFTTTDNVFRLGRKRDAHQSRRSRGYGKLTGRRSITDVRPIPSVPVRCVQVNAPDHLYLASRSMIPTHNSIVGLNIAEHIGTDLGLDAIYFSLEMDRTELMHRRIAARAGVALDHLTRHQLTDDDWARVGRHAQGAIAESRLVIDDNPIVGLAQVKARIRSMIRAGNGPKAAVVDLLGLMQEPPGARDRRLAVDGLSRGLKLIAREFGIVVIAIVQINRGPEQRTDKRPLLSDLRESGDIEASADWVFLLYREDYYEAESDRAGEIDVIIGKQRQGATCTIPLAFQGHYSRVTNLHREDPPPTAPDTPTNGRPPLRRVV
jgi:replicative DNA helicase